jgi:hypothetical protein
MALRNELRLKNLVNINGELAYVTAISEGNVRAKIITDQGDVEPIYGIIEPVLITKDHLMDFGAKIHEFYGTYSFGDFCVYVDKAGIFHFMNDPVSNASCYRLVEIKHVHRLQNLCFELTGQELQYSRNGKQ